MSVFSYTAPLFKRAARRWSEADFEAVALALRPFIGGARPILDLGGGTGDLGAGVAVHLGAHVVVADATPQMLARVSALPHVSVRLARAEDLPFPDGHFDAVLCSDAFHHFRDQRRVVAEIARVVRPSGGVLVLDMEPTGWVRVAGVFEKLLGEPSAFLTAAQMTRLMADYGISGESEIRGHSTYAFLGSVAADKDI